MDIKITSACVLLSNKGQVDLALKEEGCSFNTVEASWYPQYPCWAYTRLSPGTKIRTCLLYKDLRVIDLSNSDTRLE